jgi:hypothetical protein
LSKRSERLLVLVFVFLSGCALVPGKVDVLKWPPDVAFVEGEGDIGIVWGKEKHSGSFLIRMEYPDVLLLEVYGPFGQTLVHLKKEADKFLLVTGEERTTDEGSLQDKYGFGVRQLMDSLAMKGPIQETAEGLIIQHQDYRVVYGQDRRGRRTMRLENGDGSIRLTFTEMIFVKQ